MRVTGNNGKILESGDNIKSTIQHIAVTRDNTRNTNTRDTAKITDTVLVSNEKIIIDNPL